MTDNILVSDSIIPKLYSPTQAADLLGVSLRTLRTWIQTGDLAHTRLGKGQRLIRIREDDLLAFLNRGYQDAVEYEEIGNHHD